MSPKSHDDSLIAVRDLRVEFDTAGGTLRAVDGLSFDLLRGETLAIVGESGSGKSVTALALMGLVPAPAGRIVSGQIFFEGTDLLRKPSSYVRRLRGEQIAMVFQDPLSSLNPVLRVGYQIGEMFRRHRGASRREARIAAIDLMQRVGIPDPQKRANDYPHQFSGGMRQRAMIAIAISLDPKLLIADEPTTALDVTVQAQIMELLGDIQRELKMSMILISHDLGVVADVADWTAIMYAGRVVETGTVPDVYGRTAHPYTQGLMLCIPRLDNSPLRLVPIAGSPPDLLFPPPGCSFHPRCSYGTALCSTEAPQLRVPVGQPAFHLSACHYSEQITV